MTQYNTLNVKLSNPKLKIKKFVKKLSSAIKNWNEVTLNISLNLIGSSNDETNFPKTQLPKIVQMGGFAGNFVDLLNPDKSPIHINKKNF